MFGYKVYAITKISCRILISRIHFFKGFITQEKKRIRLKTFINKMSYK